MWTLWESIPRNQLAGWTYFWTLYSLPFNLRFPINTFRIFKLFCATTIMGKSFGFFLWSCRLVIQNGRVMIHIIRMLKASERYRFTKHFVSCFTNLTRTDGHFVDIFIMTYKCIPVVMNRVDSRYKCVKQEMYLILEIYIQITNKPHLVWRNIRAFTVQRNCIQIEMLQDLSNVVNILCWHFVERHLDKLVNTIVSCSWVFRRKYLWHLYSIWNYLSFNQSATDERLIHSASVVMKGEGRML